MQLNDLYDALLSTRRMLDAYDLANADSPFASIIRKHINRAMRRIDYRLAIELAFSK